MKAEAYRIDINTSCQVPIVDNIDNNLFNHNETRDLTITGHNFTASTLVFIDNFVINSITFNTAEEIVVNVTSGTTDQLSNLTLITCDNLILTYAIETKLSVWNDLRLGGDAFTDGNGAGNDIRYRAGMSMTRDAQGMFFTGSNPWSAWVKFESLGWTRGTNKKLQWVFTKPTSSMMIGVGSTNTNETATDQYRQAEVEAYFQNANTMWGLYGNNGAVGGTGNQANSTSIVAGTVFKIVFESDGDAGDTFTLYQLPSAAPSDWDNTSTVLNTFAIGGSLNPDEVNIMPFIIPRNGGTQRFVAVKVE